MPELTVEQALKNIDIILSAVKMNRAEQVTMVTSVAIVSKACKVDVAPPMPEEEKT